MIYFGTLLKDLHPTFRYHLIKTEPDSMEFFRIIKEDVS